MMIRSTKTYPHPFSRAYWRDAASELKDVRMLVVAALMIALRLVMKTYLAIPLAPGLKINTAFFANALGAMIFGPVMAALCAVVTDVLGYVMRPEGVYFVPFVLTEVAGSVIFALFLYRAKVTPVRAMLSRFCICFFVNVVLQTPLMLWYYQVCMGGKVYALTVPSIIKNLFAFPIESVLLTLFLSVVLPLTDRLGLTHGNSDAGSVLRFSQKQAVQLALLFVLGATCVGAYLNYYYETTSLSAFYTPDVRTEKNRSMLEYVEKKQTGDHTVTVVESAYRKFLGKETTYTVAVYTASAETDMGKAFGYSKSKAASDTTLTRIATAEIVTEEKTGKILSFQYTPAE